ACFLFKGRFEEYISVAIVIFILLLFFKLALNYLHYLSIRFIITEERVIFEFGFFNTKVDYLEMYRIYDYQMNRSLLQKLFNMMNIYLITRDVTSPVLRMQGISFNSDRS
ncbi:MAG: PH domain-containing protein, partial [Prevotella sp.]|nr:PH domain-containing protein [Prevotella sp.]